MEYKDNKVINISFINQLLVVFLFIIIVFFIYPRVKGWYLKYNQQKINELRKQNVNDIRKINKAYYDNYIKHLNELKRKENTDKVIKTYMDPPEFVILNNLLFEFTLHHKWDNIIAVGDIYKNGSYPRFKSDKELALECYKIAARCPDSDVAGVAQLKYIETVSKPNFDKNDEMGDEFPKYYAYDICNMAESIINTIPINNFDRPKNKINNVSNEGNVIDRIELTHRRSLRNRTPVVVNRTYKNDLQNVHDSGVTNIIKKNLTTLKNNYESDENSNMTKTDVLYSILEHPNLSESIKGNVVVVLDNLNNKEKHGTFDVTEEEALSLVWKEVTNEKDDVKKSNMIEILANQLDSSIENGHVVCSSGRIARIIGTLDGINDNMTLSRPVWAIREEIGNLAAKIANGNYTYPQEEFKKEVQRIYIDELKLDNRIINPIITEYIEHL